MTAIGVRALKDNLSQYLRRAKQGERIIVTDRGHPIVVLSPVQERPNAQSAWNLVESGFAQWAGGKPKGASNPPKVRGKATSEVVLEDRR